MERSDFIENRVDVVKNIYTLYSYAKSNVAEDKEWALERFEKGKWYVVEPFGDTLIFAPSRFVGYKNNTKQKHTQNHGDGTQTNKNFLKLGLYWKSTKKSMEESLLDKFRIFMTTLGKEKIKANFLIPATLNVAELENKHRCHFITPAQNKNCEEAAWKYFLNNNTIRIKEDDTRNKVVSNIQDYDLITQITEGDIVCCKNGSLGLWGIGITISYYKARNYNKDPQFAKIAGDNIQTQYHYFDVAWLCFNDIGYIPISDLNIQFPETKWKSDSISIQSTGVPKYISDYLLNRSNVDSNKNDNNKYMEVNKKYEKYVKLLEANKNLILTGAPGTGKTYMAREIAKAMGAKSEFVQFHPSYDYTDFVEGLRPVKSKDSESIGFERKDGVLKKFCNEAIKSNKLTLSFLKVPDALQLFKEDLKKNGSINISSIKSNTFTTLVKIKLSDNNLISIPNKSGWSVDDATILHYIYGDRVEDYNEYTTLIGEYIKQHYLEKATHNYVTSDKFVFIIDEINRGEISKIFGELFFSIDPGYRGAKDLRVKTQYQNLITDESDPFYEGFYVPDNVYIIGTMNDIDRSVESMDFAMRRRFAWEEVKADENTGMLDNLEDMKDDVVAVMQRLNAAIWDENTNSGIEGLSTAYHIGGAYFSKLALYLNDDHSNKEEAYTHLWNNHLKGLLFEYLRGTPDAMVKLKSLEDRYYNRNGNDTE